MTGDRDTAYITLIEYIKLRDKLLRTFPDAGDIFYKDDTDHLIDQTAKLFETKEECKQIAKTALSKRTQADIANETDSIVAECLNSFKKVYVNFKDISDITIDTTLDSRQILDDKSNISEYQIEHKF